ncbi:MAG TPA: hypothetical protein VJP89_21305 [Pyrinomonadaceae bacterium]|nr:hypothetical protein [Pyrinomonadaceae bacterium]
MFPEDIFSDPANVYRLVALIAGIGILISTAEFISNWREYTHDGIFSWKILRERKLLLGNAQFTSLTECLFDVPGFLIVLAVRLLAVTGMLVFIVVDHSLSPILLLFILVTTLLINLRHSFGMDGSDQMSSLIVVILCIYSITPANPVVAHVGLWFIALQACLSYLASGLAKLVSVKWRSGKAIFEILNTKSYGRRDVASLIQKFPFLSFIFSWSVIVLETIFPVVLLGNKPVVLLFFLALTGMHLSIALFMGLNSFFWAFTATYPAIYFCARS